MDSFTVSWHSFKFYAFPPFPVISKTLKKIKPEKAEAILLVPHWSSKAWFPVLLKIFIDISVLITSRENRLKLPEYPEMVLPMWRKIDIVVCHLTGSSQKEMEIQRSSRHTGSIVATVNKEKICWVCSDSRNVVINGMLIPFRQLPK